MMMGNFGLNGGIPWFADTVGASCFVCKQAMETVKHFLLACPRFRENFDSLWDTLKTKVTELNQTDGDQYVNFATNFVQHYKILLFGGSAVTI